MIDKNVSRDRALYTHGWNNVELTPEEIGEVVTSGIAICSQVDGYRSTSHFLASDLALVDLDNTAAVERAAEDKWVKEHVTLVYPTVSHTPERPRFRLVFALEHTISSPIEMKALHQALARQLGGDLAAVDATRISYGSQGAEYVIYDNQLDTAAVRDLIAAGLHQPQRERISDGGKTQHLAGARSAKRLGCNQEIVLSTGERVSLAAAPRGAKVFCPIHPDKNPSALIVQGRTGGKGVYCSACQQTFWGQDPPSYEFDNFATTIKEARSFAERELDGGPLGEFYDPPRPRSTIKGSNIHIAKGQPTPHDLPSGLLFIRSPKGSGKTEGISRLVKPFKRVLSIGHRRPSKRNFRSTVPGLLPGSPERKGD